MISPFLYPSIFSLFLSTFNTKYDKNTQFVFFIILTLFSSFIFCCTTTNGGDWQNYKYVYESITFNNYSSASHFEIGYVYLMLLFKALGFSFYPFFITIKLICFYLLTYKIFNMSTNIKWSQGVNPFLIFTVLYSTSFLYLFVEIIRFLIALTIIIYSYDSFIKGKTFKLLLYVSVAFLFHKSAIFIILIYPFSFINLRRKYFILLVISSLFFLNQTFILMFLDNILSFINIPDLIIVRAYLEQSVFVNSVDVFSIGNIYYLFLFILLYLYMLNNTINSSIFEDKRLYSILTIYFLLYFSTLYLGSVSRITLFLYPLFLFIYFKFINFFRGKLEYYLIVSIIIIYSLLSMYKNVYSPVMNYSNFTNYFIS